MDVDTEEVRLAMALNGGVSLAVWMGGCAVELDCARRAGWGEESQARDPQDGDGAMRTVYTALCRAFQRELVIDIMSGASAGGVNGGMLAASMVSRRRLHPDYVRDKWIELGDFSKLLHRPSDQEPHSLMQGKRFAEELLQVFKELRGEEASAVRSGLVIPEAQAENARKLIPQLDVTVTDTRGSERTFQDAWGGTLDAREYRRRFKFRNEDDFTARNLSAAARCSASFPAAFEPFKPDEESWKLTAATAASALPAGSPWTIDGGLLDNAPIRAAIELIPSRPANRQVKRYLVYVNPEPHGPPDPGATAVGSSADGKNPSDEPQLADVAGYLVNLPRKTPFVDQLEAIGDAVQGSSLIEDGVLDLLAAPLGTINRTATALLPAYTSRRRLKSLRDLLGDSAAAATAFKTLREANVDLPWIPHSMTLGNPVRWEWGLSTAIRFSHLLLDLIRLGIAERHGRRDRKRFLDARVELDRTLEDLQTAYSGTLHDQELIGRLKSPPSAVPAHERLAGLRGLAHDDEAAALAAVRQSMRIFAGLLRGFGGELEIGKDNRVEIGAAVFGEGWLDDEEFKVALGDDARGQNRLTKPELHCLRRALAIEVIRRAYWAEERVDSAQELAFVQLTPEAPSPIFTFAPFSRPFKASAETKLAGIRLGHFAGFLKGSWRANDFMWGRLDAAARIVDLLVDQSRAKAIGFDEVVGALVEALLPTEASLEQRWLVAEALADRAEPKVSAGARDPLKAAKLQPLLKEELAKDLSDKDGNARFTRTVCTRAVQLEIVRAELPQIERTCEADASDGSATKPLEFGEADKRNGDLPTEVLWKAISNVRQGAPLPVRLGRDDPAETTSDLTARTASRAGFVTLAAMRGAKLPGANALNVLRPPLLAITGMAARAFWLRIPLILGYWAAALYLTARVISTNTETADLAAVLSNQVLLALVCLLAVIGVAILPVLRGFRRRWEPVSFWEFLAGFLVLIVGGGAAIALALIFEDGITPAKLIVAEGFSDVDHAPPDWALDAAVVVGLGLPLTRAVLLRWAPSKLLEWTERGTISAGLLVAVSVLVSFWTVQILWEAIVGDDRWKMSAALTALVVPALLLLLYLWLHSVVRSSLPVTTSASE